MGSRSSKNISVLLGCTVFGFALSLSAQTSLVSQASQAFTGGVSVSSVTMSGTVTMTAGSLTKNGSATLVANADGSGSATFQYSDGSSRTETYSGYTVAPSCTWADASGTQTTMSAYNCSVVGPWFLPQMSLPNSAQQSSLQYSASGTAITIARLSGLYPLTYAQTLTASTVTLQFDPASYLASSLSSTQYDDYNPVNTSAVTVTFGGYQNYQGVSLPTQISKLINSNTYLLVQITSAIITN